MGTVIWKRIVKRTSDGRRAAAAKNQILGSTPSYGYTWNKDHTCYTLNYEVIHIEPDGTQWTEVMVVEFTFAEAKAGTPLSSIAKKLQEKGIPTRKGHSYWNPATISHMLRNQIYIGQFTAFRNTFKYNGTRVNHEGNTVANYKRIPKPLNEQHHYAPGTVPAIIDKVDDEVWKDVCRNIRNPDILAKKTEALRTPDPTEDHKIPIAIRRKNIKDEIENLVDLSRTAKSDIARSKIAGLLQQSEEAL